MWEIRLKMALKLIFTHQGVSENVVLTHAASQKNA
jgi:hypothetical protein